MSGHYLVVTAVVRGNRAIRYPILGGGQFLAQARKALTHKTGLVIPVVHGQALTHPTTTLVRRGEIVFPVDSLRDVRME